MPLCFFCLFTRSFALWGMGFFLQSVTWCLFPLLPALLHILGSLMEEALSFRLLKIVAVRFVRVLAVPEDSPSSAAVLFSLSGSI